MSDVCTCIRIFSFHVSDALVQLLSLSSRASIMVMVMIL